MEVREMLCEAYEKVLMEIEHVLEGLQVEDLDWQPGPECNSIGWLAWHLTRGEDSVIALLMRDEQLWIKDGWHEKFGRSADPGDSGTGHTPGDLAAFRSPDVETLLAYHSSVLERSRKYFTALTNQDLDRVVNLQFLPPLTTTGSLLIMMLADGMQHAGQMGYVRGLRKGLGWQKY